jgi:antitoxin CptB
MPNIAVRSRRARYRAWRRGTRELDLLLGGFASEWLEPARLDEELALFEALLEEKDSDIYNWIMGKEQNQEYAPLIDQIRAFHGK